MSAACSWPSRLLLALLALLAGCAAPRAVPDDGRMDIVWLRVDDPHRVCEGLAGRKEFLAVLGCSRWSAEQRRCEIYAPAPRDERDLQRFATLGHELMHCFEGNWHDRWGRMHDARTRQAMR
jgi:hypothetical protein